MNLDLKTLIAKAGGTAKCAQACGVTPGAVSQWLKAGSLPLSEVQGETRYAETLLKLAGIEADVWDVRLIGRKESA